MLWTTTLETIFAISCPISIMPAATITSFVDNPFSFRKHLLWMGYLLSSLDLPGGGVLNLLFLFIPLSLPRLAWSRKHQLALLSLEVLLKCFTPGFRLRLSFRESRESHKDSTSWVTELISLVVLSECGTANRVHFHFPESLWQFQDAPLFLVPAPWLIPRKLVFFPNQVELHCCGSLIPSR